MDSENQKPKEGPENLRKQLALAIRSIQWSYAIFWSISPTQPGVLEWGQGYYNVEIETKKTVQAAELNADHLGLQRSDQLRELYESLSLGETNPQATRPTSALSPEDLTDAEWYFLICMSFVFNIGQGLPGRTLAKNQMLWLCYAHSADTKVFTRSLLAKSASIQTIVCFPHLGGVVELGTTELIQEDPNLIQHIKTSFLDSPAAIVPKILNHVSNNIANNNLIYKVLDRANMPKNGINQFLDCQDKDVCSPESSSGNHVHYQSVVSNLLKSCHQLILGPYFRNGNRESSFISWKKEGLANVPKTKTPQRLLKKVLFEVARMYENSQLQSGKQNGKRVGVSKQEIDEVDRNHVLCERKRREKINERFTILGSFVPSGGKVDKVSILDHTIEYLRNLERKVQELQSERESTSQTKSHDSIERTSDNYGRKIVGNFKKPLMNKRKTRDADKTGVGNSKIRLKDSSMDNVTVNINDKEISIEMCCSWRESLLLEVVEAISKLPLVIESVQSSNSDGMIFFTMKAKAKGLKVASATVIRQALQKVA